MNGRGAWPNSGAGGTRNYNKTKPGPYYTMGVFVRNGWDDPDVNARAVHGAVLALQRALNRHRASSVPLAVDGWFGYQTEQATVAFQRSRNMQAWGGVGPDTARALLIDQVRGWAKWPDYPNYDWAVTGLIYQESMWDPGAVGYLDPDDIGLAQINGTAHPTMSEKTRLRPDEAAAFVTGYLTNALNQFDGNIKDAIASYNLGIGGTRRWIDKGRPAWYTPAGATRARFVAGYINNVVNAPRS